MKKAVLDGGHSIDSARHRCEAAAFTTLRRPCAVRSIYTVCQPTELTKVLARSDDRIRSWPFNHVGGVSTELLVQHFTRRLDARTRKPKTQMSHKHAEEYKVVRYVARVMYKSS